VDEKYIEAPSKASIHKSDFSGAGPKIRTSSSGDKERVKRKNFRRVSSVSPEPSHGGMDHGDLQTGMEVEHGKFGRGKIVQLEGNGANKKATVFFKGVGNKQLLLKFAKLKVLK